MLSKTLAVAFLVNSVLAHGDHEHQIPIQGPHKSLWYNTLPGDGGTQVGQKWMPFRSPAQLTLPGRLCLLWYFDVRSSALFPLLSIGRCKV
jgi:hypothetical protein